MGIFDQSEYRIRCEWGEDGVKTLSPISDIVIIVDVLSFSTSVDIAVNRGATVYPYQWHNESVYDFAKKVKAEVANAKNPHGYSLGPSTLENLPEDYRIVLPSPNGSQLTLLAKESIVISGCLRNAEAVAKKAMEVGEEITVIACGERWYSSNALRPSLEDFIAAGCIIRYLAGELSPESESAVAVFERFSSSLFHTIQKCSSGKEKSSKNKERDLVLASELNVSKCVPVLTNGAFEDVEDPALEPIKASAVLN